MRTPGGWLQRLMALVAGVVLGCGWAVPSARAEVSYEVQVAFTSVVADEHGITLAGTAVSTGTEPLYKVQVVLWYDPETITTKDQLQSVLTLDPQADIGDRVGTDDAVAVIVSGRTTFAPGQTANFSVTATWDELGVDQFGAYLVGVNVRASSVSWGPLVTIGWGRTLVARAAATNAQATLVMLASAPSLVHDNVFLDDHLADQLSGSLAALTELARRPGVSWAIDPALHNEITVMSKSYQVMEGGNLVEGGGGALAAAWLAQFQQLNQASGYRLPWGNPDLATAAAADDPDLIANLQTAPANPQLDRLPLLVRPANGQADQSFLDYIEPLQPAVVLAAAGAHTTWARGVLLDTHPEAYPAGFDDRGTDADLQRLQRAWAEDLVAADTTVRVVDNQADAALASRPAPPWVTTVPLGAVRATAGWTPDRSYGIAAGPRAGDIPGAMAVVGAATKAYVSLTADSSNSLVKDQMVAVWSQCGDPGAAQVYADAVAAWLHSIMRNVSVMAAPDVTLTDRTSVFPVTVANDLAVPVRIQITVSTSPVDGSLANLSIPGSEVVTVQPHDKLTIAISPTVFREGDADAYLQLATADGMAFNEPVRVRIHASITAWMGWVVVGSAVVLFAVGTIVRVKTKSAHLRRPHG